MCVCTHSKNLIFASYKLEKVHLIGLASSLSMWWCMKVAQVSNRGGVHSWLVGQREYVLCALLVQAHTRDRGVWTAGELAKASKQSVVAVPSVTVLVCAVLILHLCAGRHVT
jgi:hypothetical protein